MYIAWRVFNRYVYEVCKIYDINILTGYTRGEWQFN